MHNSLEGARRACPIACFSYCHRAQYHYGLVAGRPIANVIRLHVVSLLYDGQGLYGIIRCPSCSWHTQQLPRYLRRPSSVSAEQQSC